VQNKFGVAFYLFFIALGTGCGSLRPDPVLPAIEANYPTAEITACGKRWHGLGVCSIVKGKNYSDLKIGIQVYHAGTLVIDSKDCDVNVTMSYSKTEVIPVHIPGIADRNCIISATVSPKYPDEEKQDIRVYSFRGYLAIRALDSKDDDWEGYVRKVTKSFSSEIKLWVGEEADKVRLVVDGCGREESYDESHTAFSGWITFNLKNILPTGLVPKTCILEGFARTGIFRDLLFNVGVAKYDPKFRTLPKPIIKIDGKKLTVIASKAVSIISLNDQYEVDMEAKFENFRPNGPNILRLLTVAGRSLIGIWNVADQKWEWLGEEQFWWLT